MIIPTSPRSSNYNLWIKFQILTINEDKEILSVEADTSDVFEPFQSCFGQGVIKLYESKLVYTVKQENLAFIKLNEEITYGTMIDEENKNFYITLSKKKKVTYIQLNEKNFKIFENQLKKIVFKNDFYEQYDVIELLGNGTYSQVSLIKEKRTQKKYAVKTVSKIRVNSSIQNKKELMNEINLLRKVNNDKVLKAHEFYETDNAYKIVLEYYSGQTLENKILDQKSMKLQNICYIMKQILQGLQYLHSQNIMHRDLKPENILFVEENSLDIIIGDIGFAQDVNQNFVLSKCGTPGYIAPEIINSQGGKDYDVKADIFSCGLIFYRLVTRKSIFTGKTSDELLEDNTRFKINLNTLQFRSLPLKVQSIIQKMLEINPEKRISAKQCLLSGFYNLTIDEQNQQYPTQKPAVKQQPITIAINLKTETVQQTQIKPQSSGSQRNDSSRSRMSSRLKTEPCQQYQVKPSSNSSRFRDSPRSSFVNPSEFRIGKNEKHKIEEQLSNSMNNEFKSTSSNRSSFFSSFVSTTTVVSPATRLKSQSISKYSPLNKQSSKKDNLFSLPSEYFKTSISQFNSKKNQELK